MSDSLIVTPRSLLRRYLLAGYVLMIIYASLSPFVGWQEQGLTLLEVLSSPIRQTYTAFDALTNCLAYLPLGMLLALTLRSYVAGWRNVLLTVLAAMWLSLTLEYLQMYLPSRISSNADLLTNTLGASIGGVLVLMIAPMPWFTRATQWRIDLFQRGHGVDFGLALLMLWMFAQINPTLPMLGNVFITEAAHRIFVAMPEEPFNYWASVAVALNLLMIGLLLQTLLRVRRDAAVALMIVLCVVALAKFIAAAVLLKSWALMLWLNSEAMLGIVLGMLALWTMHSLHRVALLWVTATAALVYLMLALWVLDSGTPSAAMRLYHWRYGHLLNYNGMSQIVSGVFPLLLMGYLWRTSRRRTE
ncbi:MAG: teicoplanin resistance protein VanZ [Sideroxydans sp.]|nr:teicoplanin resistance protein VanZ [Sideroxydans sp.]